MFNTFNQIDAQSDLSDMIRLSPVEMFDMDHGNVAIEWRPETAFPLPVRSPLSLSLSSSEVNSLLGAIDVATHAVPSLEANLALLTAKLITYRATFN